MRLRQNCQCRHQSRAVRQQLGGKVADEVPRRVVLVDNLAKEEEQHDAPLFLQLAHRVGSEDRLAAASDAPHVEALMMMACNGGWDWVWVCVVDAGPRAERGRLVDPSAGAGDV